MIRKQDFWGAVALVVLIITCIVVWSALLRETNTGVLTVAFLDVGQGDAVFVESPTGRQLLIDGGPGGSVLRELGTVMSWYDRSIDVVLATHPDADHIGGLIDVLKRFRVDTIIESGALNDTPATESLLQTIAGSGATRLLARRGQVIDLGGGVYVNILFPDHDMSGSKDTNTASVIARVVYDKTSLMLTGDSPQQIEEYVARLDGAGLKSDVLKAGHHGSKTSSSELFVGFVAPKYGVFSRGCDNRYGHPHQVTVDTFARFGAKVHDTCVEGTIIFMSDGQQIRLR